MTNFETAAKAAHDKNRAICIKRNIVLESWEDAGPALRGDWYEYIFAAFASVGALHVIIE